VSWKFRAVSLVLALAGSLALLRAMPAYAESPQTGATEVRVARSALNLKRVHYSAPQYPAIALQERLSGFVTIEFVVDTKGQPVGLRIIDAQPAQVFERSVLMAAKRWRYQPLVVDNVPRERPIRMVIRFETTS